MSPDLHTRAHVRVVARLIAEYVYHEACEFTPLYRNLYELLSEGGSFARSGCTMPVFVVETITHHMANVASISKEFNADSQVTKGVFAETLDYNMHRLMQI